MWTKYKKMWKRMEVPAKTILLKEGAICRKIFYIKKGCARAWFYKEDKEISFQFFFEGDVVSSPDSFRTNRPSTFSIETVEPAELLWLNRKDMAVIKQDVALYDHIIAKTSERQAEFLNHFFSFLKDTPRQRYERILKEKPDILRRIPLQHVASYLGITQVSLSRIRRAAAIG